VLIEGRAGLLLNIDLGHDTSRRASESTTATRCGDVLRLFYGALAALFFEPLFLSYCMTRVREVKHYVNLSVILAAYAIQLTWGHTGT